MNVSKVFIFAIAGLLLAGICLNTALLVKALAGATVIYALLLISQGAGLVGLLYAFVAATVNHLTNAVLRNGNQKKSRTIKNLDEI